MTHATNGRLLVWRWAGQAAVTSQWNVSWSRNSEPLNYLNHYEKKNEPRMSIMSLCHLHWYSFRHFSVLFHSLNVKLSCSHRPYELLLAPSIITSKRKGFLQRHWEEYINSACPEGPAHCDIVHLSHDLKILTAWHATGNFIFLRVPNACMPAVLRSLFARLSTPIQLVAIIALFHHPMKPRDIIS